MSDNNTAHLTYKYRIYPNKTQLAQLDRIFSIGWRVWNDICNAVDTRYPDKVKISHFDVRDLFCGQRHNEPTLQLLPANTIDDLVRRHKKAVTAYWNDRKDPTIPPHLKRQWPHERKRAFFKGLTYKIGSGIKFIPERAKVARLRIFAVDGLIRVQFHRPLPDGWIIKYIVITNDGGQWYASLQMEGAAQLVTPSTMPEVGIDVGLVHLLALSDGQTIDHQKWYIRVQDKRTGYGQRLDRQRRFNNPDNYNPDGTAKEGVFIWRKSNRMKAIMVLDRKLARKAKHQRWYFWHVVTDWLTKEYGRIILEDLNLKFMLANGHLAKHAHDAGLGMFYQFLEDKAKRRGVTVVYVDPAYTSQTCAECGHVDSANRAERHLFKCVACGHEDHADINAARVILSRGDIGAVQTPRDDNLDERSQMIS